MTMVVDVATGVATSILWESLKRPLEALNSEIRRRDQVKRGLTDRPNVRAAKDAELLAKASEDLARIIGNGTGKLTVQVAQFLRDLRGTAIPETIAHAALCGSDPEPLRAPFSAFYNRYDDLPFSSDQLFNGMYEAFRARIDAVKDGALLEIIRAQHSVMMSRVESISQSLAKGLRESVGVGPESIQDARLRLARSILAEHKYISVESLRGPKKVPLKTISIPGRLGRLDDNHIVAAKMPQDIATSSYLSFRRQFARAVIVGDPGGGKSTLTQMLSAELAGFIVLDAANPGVRQIEQRDLQLPLRVVLRRFEVRSSKAPSYSLLDHLNDDVRVALEGDRVLAEAYLAGALGSGEAMIIFDGLDEVLDIGARARMVEQIEQFAETYPACAILVTSRLVGYRDAPMNEEFSVYGLARFNDEEIKKYSQKAIAAVGLVKVPEAKAKAVEFFSQSSKVGKDLRENPLMLGLMVQIFLNRGDVPGNRPEVYRECATLMFEKWDGRREIIADVPRHDIELLDVFGYVASRTFGDAESEEGVSRQWLVNELRKHFEDWYVDRASANRAAVSLVDFLTGRAWVMSEVGPGTFKFTHRTFLEYFFARHLISESRGIDELLTVDLVPHVINNQWSVISHLALHMAVFRDGGKSRQAVQSLERLLDSLTLPAPQEFAFLRFVASAIPYLVIPESSYLRVISKTVHRVMVLGGHEDVSALSIIDYILMTATTKLKLANAEIISQVSSALSNGDLVRLRLAVYALGYGHSEVGSLSRSRRNLPDASLWRTLKGSREEHRSRLRRLAESDVGIARAYVYVYGVDREPLYEKHGEKFLLASASTLEPVEIDRELFHAIQIAMERSIRKDDAAYRDSTAFISKLAQSVVSGELRLGRLLSPAHLKDRAFRFAAEAAFREIWIAARMGAVNRPLQRAEVECLVCLLSASETDIHFDRLKGELLTRDADVGHVLPGQAVRAIVERVRDQELGPWLHAWVSEHVKPDRERVRASRSA